MRSMVFSENTLLAFWVDPSRQLWSEGVGDRYTGAKAKGHATIKINGGLTFYVCPTIWQIQSILGRVALVRRKANKNKDNGLMNRGIH